jgi:hypothetical protein
MVDDGKKLYTRRNATDAQTGRTISTPHYARERGSGRSDGSMVSKLLLYGGIAIVILAIAIGVWRAWFV